MNFSKEPNFGSLLAVLEINRLMQEERDKLVQLLKDAVELSSICSDWNLYEVEIRGEMRSIYDVHRDFIEAVNMGSKDWQKISFDQLGIDEEE